MKLKVMIVDDEPHAIEVIEKYLADFSEINVVLKCNNGIQAFQFLQQQKADLLFLDIHMPGLKGTELLRTLKDPPRVIFTTAYQDYALEGFDLNATDYLVKPIPFDRFLRAMNKVFELFRGQILQTAPASGKNTTPSSDVFLYLKVDRKMVKVNVNDIYWMESQKDYIRVVLRDKELVSKQKISVLEALLPEDKFARVHRSYIVSVNKIESYHAYSVEVGGKQLPIGRNYKAECHRRFNTAY